MRRILLYVIVMMLALCTYLSISYAYYSITPSGSGNISADVNISGCVSLQVSNTINISGDYAIPVNDAKALSSNNYRTEFTLYNRCDTAQEVQLAFAPGAANTMPSKLLEYVVYEQGSAAPTAGTALLTNGIELAPSVISDVATMTGDTVSTGYLLDNTFAVAANSSKSYYAYLWINKDEGGTSNTAINKVVKMHLVLGNTGELTNTTTLAGYLVNTAPRSGTDTITSKAWMLTEDHPGEWRFAGKNPNNYILFNNELWRIIGIMPNMEYCTGTYGNASECSTTKTGSLIKIIRNDSLGAFSFDYKASGVGTSSSSYGSNDWTDSQLMLMLNGTNYLKTGYSAAGTQLHTAYTITNNVVSGRGYNYYNATYSYLDGNGTTVYKPTQATASAYTATEATLPSKISSTALSQIATVKWNLYGTGSYSTAAEGSAEAWYNKERNINNSGSVYNMTTSGREKRAVYWYGKVGLMSISDYGFATYGSGGSSYTRATCLGIQINSWSSSSYKTNCAANSYLWYTGVTDTAPGSSGVIQWTLNPLSSYAYREFYINSTGNISYNSTSTATYNVRPVVYLKSDVTYHGGTGTWNDPYRIDGLPSYWFALSTWNENTGQYEPSYTHPNYGGTLQSSGTATGHNIYIGQDSSKYYACATIQGHEICLSQPYTQYGLSGHTLNSNFTSAQQASAKQAIYQAFIDAGITVDIGDCSTSGYIARCNVGNLYCGVYPGGFVRCSDSIINGYCDVDVSGHAYCAYYASLEV